MRAYFQGEGRACVIAEVAQAHDGSLGLAHAYIDAAAAAGADAVKFQTHIASAESTAAEPWRVKFSPQDGTRRDYWRRMEFTEEQWRGLAYHAREKGLSFVSSPFSVEAVDMLSRVGVDAWKVASGEVRSVGMLERMAASGTPVILSSGMSSWKDLDEAVALLRRHEAHFAVLQCATAYPCPPEKVGLNVMSELKERYGCPSGLSDHSGVVFPALAASVLGARFVEVHITMSREMFGPDVPASVTTSELRQIVDGVRFYAAMERNPVDKEAEADRLRDMRSIFGKSAVAKTALPVGALVRPEDLAFKKPGDGVHEADAHRLHNRRLRVARDVDEQIREEHVE